MNFLHVSLHHDIIRSRDYLWRHYLSPGYVKFHKLSALGSSRLYHYIVPILLYNIRGAARSTEDYKIGINSCDYTYTNTIHFSDTEKHENAENTKICPKIYKTKRETKSFGNNFCQIVQSPQCSVKFFCFNIIRMGAFSKKDSFHPSHKVERSSVRGEENWMSGELF